VSFRSKLPHSSLFHGSPLFQELRFLHSWAGLFTRWAPDRAGHQRGTFLGRYDRWKRISLEIIKGREPPRRGHST